MPSIMSTRETSLNQNLVLTRVVQGNRTQEDKFAGDFISPIVPVPTPQGQLLEFDNSNQVVYETRRAPGSTTKRRRIGYMGRPYILHQDSIEGELPKEILRDSLAYSRYGLGGGENGRGIPYDLERRTVEGAMESLKLRLEYDRASLLTDPANYDAANVRTLTGAEQLNDPNSDIIGLFDTAREAIADKILDEANSALFSRKAFNAAINHPQIRAYFTGVTSQVAAEEELARILRLTRGVRVARAKKLMDGSTGDFESLWGNNLMIFYTPETQSPNRLEPAFSYTYQLDGHPYAEEPYEERNTKTWYYPVTDERETYIVGKGSGYLVRDVVAA